jgi:RND superfamily putative drug exporter
MFAWWGSVVVRARWAVLAAGAAFVVVGVLWGTGVFGSLVGGGFEDPGSQAVKARQQIEATVGRQDVDVVVLYSSSASTVDDPAFKDAVGSALAKVQGDQGVAGVLSFWNTQSPAFVSADRHSAYAAIRFKDAGSKDTLHAIRPDLRAAGLTTQVGGPAAVVDDVSSRVEKDIVGAETLSMPLLLLLLIFIFRGVVAALMPLMVGGTAILGAFIATRVLTSFTDISVFAANIITMLGLGMAVDYALFVVSRFREELAGGADVPTAIRRTMVTAGRTVAFSGLTVALALSSLLIFPEVFLRSMGYGGVAAVIVAMVSALTLLPAVLAVLGHRINAWRIPVPRAKNPGGGWERLAKGVMRRPLWVIAGTLIVLALLASPFTQAKFGQASARALPVGTESRVVGERIAADFPGHGADPIEVLVTGPVGDLPARIQALPHVGGVTVAGSKGSATLLDVAYDESDGATSSLARGVVGDIRALTPPSGSQVLVGGAAASTRDVLSNLGSRLPWMALLVAMTTMVLLFLAFGSVVLPVKAVLMNMVSIGASFGAVVFVFQDGHFASWLGFTPGDLEASQLILMLALLFGLSTDYEVFLLSRVREEWDRTGDNNTAVVAGLRRTGGIITSAAVLLMIVVGGFATGGISFIKMIGVGMVVAILVDATIVRALLVPATMRLLGRWNWWAPGPLAAFYRRFGMKESSGTPEQAPELVSV